MVVMVEKQLSSRDEGGNLEYRPGSLTYPCVKVQRDDSLTGGLKRLLKPWPPLTRETSCLLKC